MAKIYYQEDCNLSMLEGKTIAVIGYGSQGHAHALNLKESGCDVIIGLYEGSRSWKRAEEQGFTVYTAAEAAKRADIIMILINDELQADMYKKDIEPNLKDGDMLMFAHGFNIHFGCIKPPKNVDVTMIAPKAPGHTVRSEYQAGKGTPHFFSFFQGTYIRTALEYDFQKNWCDDRCDHYHDDNRSEEIAAQHTECFSLAGNDQRNLTTGDHSDTDSCTLIILISTHLRTKGTANDLCQDRNNGKRHCKAYNCSTHLRKFYLQPDTCEKYR